MAAAGGRGSAPRRGAKQAGNPPRGERVVDGLDPCGAGQRIFWHREAESAVDPSRSQRPGEGGGPRRVCQGRKVEPQCSAPFGAGSALPSRSRGPSLKAKPSSRSHLWGVRGAPRHRHRLKMGKERGEGGRAEGAKAEPGPRRGPGGSARRRRRASLDGAAKPGQGKGGPARPRGANGREAGAGPRGRGQGKNSACESGGTCDESGGKECKCSRCELGVSRGRGWEVGRMELPGYWWAFPIEWFGGFYAVHDLLDACRGAPPRAGPRIGSRAGRGRARRWMGWMLWMGYRAPLACWILVFGIRGEGW